MSYSKIYVLKMWIANKVSRIRVKKNCVKTKTIINTVFQRLLPVQIFNEGIIKIPLLLKLKYQIKYQVM